MPLYEYECKKCHHRFEKILKFSDSHIKKCPECGGPVEQLLSAPAVQFKGSGWYVTDYAKKGAVPAAASGDSPAKESATAQHKKEHEPKAQSHAPSESKKTEKHR